MNYGTGKRYMIFNINLKSFAKYPEVILGIAGKMHA